jgi:hypothetical protein
LFVERDSLTEHIRAFKEAADRHRRRAATAGGGLALAVVTEVVLAAAPFTEIDADLARAFGGLAAVCFSVSAVSDGIKAVQESNNAAALIAEQARQEWDPQG